MNLRILLVAPFLVFLNTRSVGQNTFLKNNITLASIYGFAEPKENTYFNYNPLEFRKSFFQYTRRPHKNFSFYVGTYLLSKENRRFYIGSKTNMFVRRRLQPSFLIDITNNTQDYNGDLNIGVGYELHIGKHFIMNSYYRFGVVWHASLFSGIGYKF